MKTYLPFAIGLSLLAAFAPVTNAQKSAAPAAKTPPTRQATTATLPVIEEKAMSLLKKNQQAMFALKSYSAECRTILTRDKPRAKSPKGEYKLATLISEKPNKMRYDSWELVGSPPASAWAKPSAAPTYTFACDGKNNFHQFGKMYRPAGGVTPEYMTTILEPWNGFYTFKDSAYGSALEYRKKNQLREARIVGHEAVQGVNCDKVLLHILSDYNGQKYETSATWYFGPDGLTRRCVEHVSFDDKPGTTRDATLTGIHLNKPVKTGVYAYTPPQGVTLEQEDKPLPLLANGTVAPDFTATDINNKPVKLSDLRGKVVVIDFWASWCGPCNAAMPHNQAVIKKLKAQGLPVVMLAVDNGDGRADFEGWVKPRQASLSDVNFVFVSTKEDLSGKKFQISGIPTQYVLDKNGVICASFVGFDKPNDDLEHAVRAALGKSGTVKAVTSTAKK